MATAQAPRLPRSALPVTKGVMPLSPARAALLSPRFVAWLTPAQREQLPSISDADLEDLWTLYANGVR